MYWNSKIVICEPYYTGGLLIDIVQTCKQPTKYKMIGVSHQFLTHYGTYEEQNEFMGLTVDNIERELGEFIYE
jgi:transketolase